MEKGNARDSAEDRDKQRKIRMRARLSLAIFSTALMRHGSGRFLMFGRSPLGKLKK